VVSPWSGILAILRLRSCRRDVQPGGHRGGERHGSASVASRRSGSHRCTSSSLTRRRQQ
jgi:hypothetical protein